MPPVINSVISPPPRFEVKKITVCDKSTFRLSPNVSVALSNIPSSNCHSASLAFSISSNNSKESFSLSVCEAASASWVISGCVSQEALAASHTDKLKLSLLLFDEIEKASEALWQLLLGMLDKATLTLGDNRKVDLSQTVIFLTSNLGGGEITELMQGGMGFI